jgi:hypothetical protein
MKKTSTRKLSLKKESLRVLSDKALERVAGAVYTSTVDVCSTESLSKCYAGDNRCYYRQ